VKRDGTADLDWLESRVHSWKPKDGPLFAVLSLANNETGVIQPVAAAAALIHAAGGVLHVDAVQAAGKIPVDVRTLGADTLALSAHKLGGPQGVGALVAGPNAVLSRRQHGGGQERGRRAGTENVSGIAGFGAAAAVAAAELDQAGAQAAWRDAAQAKLAGVSGVAVYGADAPRLPGVLCFSTDGFASDKQVMALDLEGVMVSAGAACSSGKVTPSHVLTAMGFGEAANTSIRASGGWATTPADWDRFLEAWFAAHARVRLRALAEA